MNQEQPKKDNKNTNEQKQGITRYSVKKIRYLRTKHVYNPLFPPAKF
jgi:hypothetical protein